MIAGGRPGRRRRRPAPDAEVADMDVDSDADTDTDDVGMRVALGPSSGPRPGAESPVMASDPVSDQLLFDDDIRPVFVTSGGLRESSTPYISDRTLEMRSGCVRA